MFDQGEIFYDALFGDKEAGKNTSKWNYFPYQICLLYTSKGIESNYGKELEQTLMQGTYQLFESIVEEENLYQNYSRQELKLILRYHSHAIFGILQDWTPEDTKNLDMIVHEVYLIMMGKNAPEEL